MSLAHIICSAGIAIHGCFVEERAYFQDRKSILHRMQRDGALGRPVCTWNVAYQEDISTRDLLVLKGILLAIGSDRKSVLE